MSEDDAEGGDKHIDLISLNQFAESMRLYPDPQADGSPENEGDSDNEEDEAAMDELTEQEYASVDRALDEMLTFMDVLEERSNDLFAKMHELLADSRQIREEMQAANEKEHKDDDDDSGEAAKQPSVS